MHRLQAAIVLMTIISLSPAKAQESEIPDQSAQSILPDSNVSTIRLDRIRIDTETAGTTGSLKSGTLCISSDPFNWDRIRNRDVPQWFYENRFSDAMTDSGFRIIDPSRDLFADDGQEGEANFLVGAIILPRTVDICRSIPMRLKGRVVSDVEFQLFDNRTDQVVYSVTYSGEAEFPTFRDNGNLGMLIAASFRDAAARFAADPEVLRYAGS